MFNELKLAFQSFKRNWADYLAISFVFGMIVYIGVLIGYLAIGFLLAFIFVVIPAIISLKFNAFQWHDKPVVESRSLKIGFLTFFKSIKVYSIVILKPLLIGLGVGIFMYSIFISVGIDIASKTMPNIMESMGDTESFVYMIEEIRGIENVNKIINIGAICSCVVGYFVYFCLKLKRDFIPFIAFEMPINSKRAVAMNAKVMEKKNYLRFMLCNLVILAMLVVPGALAYLAKVVLSSNEVFSPTTINLIMALVFCVLSSPIFMIKQLHYVYSYKYYSKPFKDDFNNELKNVIKEMEELAKKIDDINK